MDNKKAFLELLDTLDKMTSSNLAYLEFTERIYKLRLEAIAIMAQDSKNVNIESTLMRTEIMESMEDLTAEQQNDFLIKLDGLRIRLSKPLSMIRAEV